MALALEGPLAGRVALVSSGARGLGRAVVRHLAEAGAHVVLTSAHDEKAGRAAEAEIRSLGGHALFVKADAGVKDDVGRTFGEVDATFGRLDILVNAAGPYVFERLPLVEYTDADWHRLLDGNLTSVFHHVREAVPRMRKANFGRIVNFGFDGAGRLPPWPGRAPYAAFKEGVVSLSLSLAREVAPFGITVNVVCPGRIVEPHKTARIADVRNLGSDRVPVGRPGSGEDVARVVAFLCHPDSDFLTGNVIDVDGGEDVLHGQGS